MPGLRLGFPILAALVFLQTGTVQAEDLEIGACRADAEKLCKDVRPGDGRMARCLKQHEASVSPACKDAMVRARQKMQALREACAGRCEAVLQGRQVRTRPDAGVPKTERSKAVRGLPRGDAGCSWRGDSELIWFPIAVTLRNLTFWNTPVGLRSRACLLP